MTIKDTSEGIVTAAAPVDRAADGTERDSRSSKSVETTVRIPFSENEDDDPESNNFTSTRNACKLCTPLGACLVFRGVEGCIPFLHGSQGCSTYIRRYLISHFREPIDIASSNFHEESAIFGGASNFKQGVRNIVRQYQPKLIGVATTCLAETIGENMPQLLEDLRRENPDFLTPVVTVSTASYRGTHMEGFHSAVKALVEQLTDVADADTRSTINVLGEYGTDCDFSFASPIPAVVNLFPGMLSAADLRHLKEIFADFNCPVILLPDYSETMDGETWEHYEKLQSGGTPVSAIASMGRAGASIEFGRTLAHNKTAASVLSDNSKVARHLLGIPIGVRESDRFFSLLEEVSGRELPPKYRKERGRLIDSYIDGHKYLFEKRAVVFGEEDLVIGLASFLADIGVTPVLCATGGRSGQFARCLKEAVPNLPDETIIKDGFDFAEIAEIAPSLAPDFLLGSSKGYSIARKLKVPLIRVGFPIHDRIGGQRVLHVGYRGAQGLFDTIVNTLMERKQEISPVGYSYL